MVRNKTECRNVYGSYVKKHRRARNIQLKEHKKCSYTCTYLHSVQPHKRKYRQEQRAQLKSVDHI